MKNMMRTTQGTALREMYGDLVKGWALSPDETQTFYDLLLDKQMDQMDQGMKILEKGSDAIKTADAGDPDARSRLPWATTSTSNIRITRRPSPGVWRSTSSSSNSPPATPRR